MAYDNQYPNRKDWRRAYEHRAYRIDRSCRPGGDDPWSRGNRLRASELRQRIADEQIDEFQDEGSRE